MGVIDSIRDALEPETNGRSDIAGAFWCDDCSIREPVTDAELDDDRVCPECGASMRLERTPDSGSCAC
ncbi:hypothetical protein [Natronorubrum tibetense]|uniref:Small CPxCG-related zinc finger protein n=1 Tax=Natronorubrum tibetense GA33 TaxID=1114856 RepID=L9VYR0_9EURY|nr:hypothetical protein [Natronorubrum tibetense]ELY42314.1 hypothetical protein C496_07943 [Natronorubrum tibetense GA33]